MNRKTLELLHLLAIPLMMLVTGLVVLGLASLVQHLSGEGIGAGGFAVPVIVGVLVATVATMARLLTQNGDTR
jgi:xanthine/uracil permease